MKLTTLFLSAFLIVQISSAMDTDMDYTPLSSPVSSDLRRLVEKATMQILGYNNLDEVLNIIFENKQKIEIKISNDDLTHFISRIMQKKSLDYIVQNRMQKDEFTEEEMKSTIINAIKAYRTDIYSKLSDLAKPKTVRYTLQPIKDPNVEENNIGDCCVIS